jgi:hypothetical protein
MTKFQVLTQEGPTTHAIDKSGTWPGWAPEAARNYLAHNEGGARSATSPARPRCIRAPSCGRCGGWNRRAKTLWSMPL